MSRKWTRNDTIMLITLPLWVFPFLVGCIGGLIIVAIVSGFDGVYDWYKNPMD
jgi:paraquat-inducible protein B